MSRSRPRKTGARRSTGTRKRRYNSPLREQRLAETRERLISSGAELVHGFSTWNWKELTFRAVGERAGVSSRTVHRYFRNERELRDAILQRLMEESGIALERFEVSTFASLVSQIFRYLSSFAATSSSVEDPSFAAMDRHRRTALLAAVTRATPEWSVKEREMTAAMLDMLWDIPPYARLMTAWRLEPERAIAAISWVIGLIEEAIKDGRRPASK